jgi:hypothetical protein
VDKKRSFIGFLSQLQPWWLTLLLTYNETKENKLTMVPISVFQSLILKGMFHLDFIYFFISLFDRAFSLVLRPILWNSKTFGFVHFHKKFRSSLV